MTSQVRPRWTKPDRSSNDQFVGMIGRPPRISSGTVVPPAPKGLLAPIAKSECMAATDLASSLLAPPAASRKTQRLTCARPPPNSNAKRQLPLALGRRPCMTGHECGADIARGRPRNPEVSQAADRGPDDGDGIKKPLELRPLKRATPLWREVESAPLRARPARSLSSRC
jgi:hypothetical protein